MDMNVRDIMTKDVFAVAPETDLETAARLLTERRIHGAPVVDSNRRAIGVISLVDLADPDRARGNSEGYPIFYRVSDGWAEELGNAVSPASGRVEEVMTPAVVSVDASTPVRRAAEQLLTLGVHRLLVTERGALVGIVSAIDLLRAYHTNGSA